MTWRRGDLRDELVGELDRHGMTLAVPSATLVTSVTRVTPGQPPWIPTLPTPWLATQAQINKKLAKQRRRRDDFTVKAATELTAQHSLIVLEKLQLPNMTKTPAAKPDPNQPGAFLPNRAAAKAGLNRAILAKGWGKFAAPYTTKPGTQAL